jgi:hypothetical protein
VIYHGISGISSGQVPGIPSKVAASSAARRSKWITHIPLCWPFFLDRQ